MLLCILILCFLTPLATYAGQPPGPAEDEVMYASFELMALSQGFVEHLDIVVPADGLSAIAFEDFDTLYLAKCRRLDCATGTDRTRISDPGVLNNDGLLVSLFTGSDGLPVVTHMDEDLGALWTAKCNTQACDDRTTELLYAGRVSGVDGAVGADGFPMFSFYDRATKQLHFVQCADVTCAQSTDVTLPATTIVVAETAIGLGSDGFPVIAHEVRAPGASFFRVDITHCQTSACDGETDSATLDLGPLVQGAESQPGSLAMLIGQDGLPLTLFRVRLATGGNAVATVHCKTAECDLQGGLALVASSSSYRKHLGFTLSADGLPMAAIDTGSSSAGVMFLQCQSQTCEGDVTTRGIPRARIEEGQNPAIAAAADGNPIIVGRQFGTSRVAIVHCRDPECVNMVSY